MRRAVLAVIMVGCSALPLAACTSGGGDTFTPPTHSPTTHSAAAPGGSAHASRSAAAAARRHQKLCAGLLGAGTRFATAERTFYTNTAKQNQVAIRGINRELQRVADLAPRQIKTPLHDMIAGFHTFVTVLGHPTAQSSAKLAALAQRLTADGKQLSSYVTAHCSTS
jgi:hypothetical protein